MIIQIRKGQFVRKPVRINGTKFYEDYSRTQVKIFGCPIYTKYIFISRERALAQ